MVFQPFWSEKGYQVRPFWSEREYGLLNLVLNWVCFLEELATSWSFGDKTISLLMFTPNYRVRAVTACHALLSRAGHQGFRYEIERDWLPLWTRSSCNLIHGIYYLTWLHHDYRLSVPWPHYPWHLARGRGSWVWVWVNVVGKKSIEKNDKVK